MVSQASGHERSIDALVDADYSLQSVWPNDADIKPNLAIDSRLQVYPGPAEPCQGAGPMGRPGGLIGALHLDQQVPIFVIRFAQSEHPLVRLIVIHDSQTKSSRSRILRLALVLCSLAAWGLGLSAARAPAAKDRGESGGKAPVIESESESNISERGVTLEAQINPEGSETEYGLWVECGVVFQCGSAERVESGRLPAGDSGQAVSFVASSVQSGNRYKYWVVATSSEGTTMGIVRIFAPYESWPGPVSETGAASNVTEHEATLEGEIEPAEKGLDGFAYFFEYGASASYGASAPAPPGGTIGPSASCGLICEGLESFPKRVRVDLAGLEPGTTYHYRLVSTNVNEGYRSFGEDATFTTGGEKPPPSSGGSETPSTTGGDGQLGASSTLSSLTSGVTSLVSPLGGTIAPKALTKAQKLAKALKRCRQGPKRKRAACGRDVRKKKQATTGKDTGERASQHDQRRRE